MPAAQYQAADTNDNLEKTPTITSSGTITGCTGHPGITSGSFSNAVIVTHDPSDCNELLNVGDTSDGTTPDAALPNGTTHIVWNDGSTSDGATKLKAVLNQPTEVKVVTKGTAGLFTGLKSKVTVTFTANGGGCTTADLTSVNFSNATTGPLVIG